MGPSPIRQFSAPPYVIAGLGALDRLAAELERTGATRVTIACDRGVERAGLLRRVQEAAGTVPGSVCALVNPDPSIQDAEDAAGSAIQDGAEAVIALGGGSALALGRAVALRLRNPEPIGAYAGVDRAPRRPAPCIAIPTTAGSGGEVSDALTLHDPAEQQILVVRGRGYEAQVAILDGRLLATLPERPMVEAGLDALSHALEALWAVNTSTFTDGLALAAAGHICDTLPRALDGRDPADLQRLLEASAMANLACGNAGLGLVHALSSAAAIALPHGYQNGVLLPAVAQFNRPALRPAAVNAVDRALQLYDELAFDPNFSKGEVREGDVELMIAAARDHVFRTNNVRMASDDEMRAILHASGAGRANASVS